MEEGLKGRLYCFLGSRGAGAPLDPVLDPPLVIRNGNGVSLGSEKKGTLLYPFLKLPY